MDKAYGRTKAYIRAINHLAKSSLATEVEIDLVHAIWNRSRVKIREDIAAVLAGEVLQRPNSDGYVIHFHDE